MNKQLEEVAAFLREHRSNESNFEKIYQKLQEEKRTGGEPNYIAALQDVQQRAEEYRNAKEKGAAYPEFEKFVSEFEKAVTQESRME